MEKQIIISIGREYGSGGHEIGAKVAEKLDLPFYDRNLLDEVASVKNVDSNDLAKYDEVPKKHFFSRTVRGHSNSPEENVAQLQFMLLKSKAADDDSFVIVGRCSDEIFEGIAGYISIFISGNLDCRIKRVMERRNVNEKEAIKIIERHDKKRKAYHDHFCKGKWGAAATYDLCINSSTLGVDASVDLIVDYVNNYIKGKVI